MDIFWSSGPNALNFYQELCVQKRIDDPFWNVFLQECRAGALTEEIYNFLMGFPTEHAGSWLPQESGEKQNISCQNIGCEQLPHVWRDMALAGASWEEMRVKWNEPAETASSPPKMPAS